MHTQIRELLGHGTTAFASIGLVLVAAWGCRSKIDVHTRAGSGMPIESKPSTDPLASTLPGDGGAGPSQVKKDAAKALIPVKTVYQSREVVRVKLSNELIGGALSLSIYNVTGFAEETEADAPALVQDAPIPANLSLADGPMQLADISGIEVVRNAEGIIVSILPSAKDIRRLLRYGENKLKIAAHDPFEVRFTYTTVTLQDFDVFGPTMVGIPGEGVSQGGGQDASQGSQFQGWLNVVNPPVVSSMDEGNNVTGYLTHGVFNIMN